MDQIPDQDLLAFVHGDVYSNADAAHPQRHHHQLAKSDAPPHNLSNWERHPFLLLPPLLVLFPHPEPLTQRTDRHSLSHRDLQCDALGALPQPESE